MHIKELKVRAEKQGFNYAYNHFDKDVKPPYLVGKCEETDNFNADNKVYMLKQNVVLDLIVDKKDLELENKVEEHILFDVNWDKEENYIESERVYNIKYRFEI